MSSMSCFICDEKVGSDKVHLATGIAPHSKLGLPAKISNLIGLDFVVVVTQSDHVCRRCSALINHMDKLETELTYVKKAISGYIRSKYNLPVDEDSKSLQSNNGSSINGDASPPAKRARRTPISTPQTKTQISTPLSKGTPQDDAPKLKIYKCGFCAFQSKDLNSVRLHMKIHIKGKEEVTPTKRSIAPLPNATSTPTTQPAQPPMIRKKLFRCQVCSASFVDRKSCLQHIKMTHSKASNKENENESTNNTEANGEQQEQPLDEALDTQPPSTDPTDTQDATSLDQQDGTVKTEGKLEITQEGTLSTAPSEDTQPNDENTTKADEVTESDPIGTGGEGNGTAAIPENNQETEAASEETTKVQDGTTEQKEDLDIEAMIAALHSDTASTNSESIAMNL